MAPRVKAITGASVSLIRLDVYNRIEKGLTGKPFRKGKNVGHEMPACLHGFLTCIFSPQGHHPSFKNEIKSIGLKHKGFSRFLRFLMITLLLP